MSLNFMVSLTASNETQPGNISVEFSKSAVAIESGQPVFSKDTKIWVSNPTMEEVKIYINEQEKVGKDSKIEFQDLEEGTYTLMIVPAKKSAEESEIVGFTIQ
ncbi:MAG: hypothetical protein Tsb0034_23050 [Ekhidna sp.]